MLGSGFGDAGLGFRAGATIVVEWISLVMA